MRKLILKMSMSLDGFVGGPQGEIDWLLRTYDDEATAWTVENLWLAGAHVMGSRTFHDMASYWPASREPFAPPMNEIPKVVFSRKGLAAAGADPASTTRALVDALAQLNPRSEDEGAARETWAKARVVTGELSDEIGRLKQEPGRDLLAHGGAGFARSLVACGAVDEYRLLIHPVALGRGLPLFSDLPRPVDLALVEARSFRGGAVAQIYRPRP